MEFWMTKLKHSEMGKKMIEKGTIGSKQMQAMCRMCQGRVLTKIPTVQKIIMVKRIMELLPLKP